MIGFAVAVLVFLMVGALIYEACDIHDPKPFFTDPECLLLLLSSMLIFCVGIVASVRCLYSFCLALIELLPLGISGLSFSWNFQHGTFDFEHLLFSPPRGVTSLRI